jgi:hypothetical protein
LKSWPPRPMFVTLKVIGPAGSAENFDSLKASSLGLPAVTVTTTTSRRRGAWPGESRCYNRSVVEPPP